MHDTETFFAPAFDLTTGRVTELCGAVASGAKQDERALAGLCATSDPVPDALTFVESAKQMHAGLAVCGAVLVRERDAAAVPDGPIVMGVDHPQLAFSKVVAALYPASLQLDRLLDDDDSWTQQGGSSIAGKARLEPDVTVLPGAIVGSGAEIGRGTVIGAHAVIGNRCKIGRDCQIGPGASITCAMLGDEVVIHAGVRIGQDGFGYRPVADRLMKLPQIGRVIIQNHVEIGANSTIDRGAIGDTVIGEGTKIDNLVQIAHNVQVGRNVILCAQVGISGSSVIGDGAMLGGNAGIADHIRIGARAQIAAAAGVMHDVPDGERWGGAPAQPLRSFFREINTLRTLAKNNKG